MPLYSKEKINGGILALWEVTESPEELLEQVTLSKDEKERFNKFLNMRRKKEWLATRILLKEVISGPLLICYGEDGKPFLKDSPYNIGISHSTEFVGIYVHKEKIPGIDIENINRQIEKIAPKFMSYTELQFCLSSKNEYSNEKLFIHWGAKEAVFKMIPDPGVDFATQIIILPFEINKPKGKLSAVYSNKQEHSTIPLSYRFIKNNLMVWGVI